MASETFVDPMLEWLTPAEVGDIIGLERRAVIRHLNSGDLVGYRYGNRTRGTWRIQRKDLEAYMRRSRNRPPQE